MRPLKAVPKGALRGRELGKTGSQGNVLFAIRTCPTCGNKQLMELRTGGFKRQQCFKCYLASQRGSTHSRWNGGRHKNHRGYINIWLPKTDFFYSMCNRTGYVDNRIENLILISNDKHNQITILANRVSYLEQRVTLLEADNLLLRSQLSESKSPSTL